MSEQDKPKLGARPALGIKRETQIGQVKQSFSHGRTNTVMVEVKKKRFIAKPEPEAVAPAPAPEAAPKPLPVPLVSAAPVPDVAPPAPLPLPLVSSAPVPDVTPAPVPAPVAPPPAPLAVEPEPAPAPVVEAPAPAPQVEAPIAAAIAPTPAPSPAPAAAIVAPAAKAPAPQPARSGQLNRPGQPNRPGQANRPGAARPAPKLAPRREPILTRLELQEKFLREAEEARMNALEDARKREEKERQEAAEKALEAAAAKAQAEAEKAAAKAQEQAAQAASKSQATAPISTGEDDKPGRRRLTSAVPTRKPEPARPSRGKGEQDRRQSGKLSVNRALDDGDDARARSLAALKRAREKERRAHMQSGPAAKQVRDVTVPERITVADLANRMAERTSDLIKALFKMGMAIKGADEIDQDTAELLVADFGHNIIRVAADDVEIKTTEDVDAPDTLQPRPPVITIMGHVDHGKTSLLDALRGTDVVAGEAGGITQHIGAYHITTKSGAHVTFLDTPGHAAFTAMRQRGANATDIAVLVCAADDGLKPQTVESINHAKAANVPIIVAITKIDKHEANPQKVREGLLQHEVIVEEMSGDVLDAEVSAKEKMGLDTLIEKILLQAELMELKANPDRPAEGVVIEAQLDKGRGSVATVLVQRGTLRVGDIFVCGQESGRVRALIDDKGRQVKSAGPSIPVEVLGLTGVPRSGDMLNVVENEGRAREVAAYRAQLATTKRTVAGPTSLDNMFSALKAKQAQEYPLVVKGDVHGSVEAIAAAVTALSNDDIKVRVMHSGVGGITESDVTLAAAFGAPVIGFNVRGNAKAREVAEKNHVALKYYDVIYDLIDDMRAALAGQLGPELFETVVGRAEIREVFSAGKHGKAAGLLVLEGYIRKALRARVMRDDVIIYNGSVSSLRRFKDDVAEVRAGLECGVTLEATIDIKKGDVLETFEVEERARII
jgi:translation initiation factor IF-2